MPERPLLIFPDPARANRRSLPPAIPKAPRRPSPGGQRDRLEAKLTELEQMFVRRQVELRGDPAGAEIEQVLVLETVGRVDDFAKAIKRLEGLEWMGDLDVEGIAPDEDFFFEDDPQKPLTGRLYLIMSNQRGLRELLSLWEQYRASPDDPRFVKGRTKWKHMFNLLRDIRPWGAQDRLHETGLLEVWQERVTDGAERLTIEVELWPRQNPDQRVAAMRTVEQAVAGAGGQVVGQAYIADIHYHGVLVELPIQAVESLLAVEPTRLVTCDQVMFLRPAGQAIAPQPGEEPLPGQDADRDLPEPVGEPVVALLDGYPLENHELLSGRLVVDDPDDWAGECASADRRHGTAMASLILHGELDAEESALARPLYVRPIMKPVDGFRQTYECIPESILPVDIVHRAIRRIKEGEAGEDPVAPYVCVVNLSVGDLRHSFHGYPTPWARLLDLLAWRYQLLFIVSAGNYSNDIELDVPRADFPRLRTDPLALERETIRAVARQGRFRPLLSPADATNALTVGAVHNDRSPAVDLRGRIDPIQSPSLPSPFNAQGPGFRRSVKPDIMHDGGRQTYTERFGTDNATLALSPVVVAPGQRVAAPSSDPGDLRKNVYTRGTSNATALTTRAASKVYDVLAELRAEPGGELLEERYTAVVLKALLAHSASWGGAADTIEPLLNATDSYRRKLALARMLGYGIIRPERVLESTAQRATLIGASELGAGQAHVYSLPLPPGLSGRTVWRRLTITLAWMTPINPMHRSYRKAALWVEPYDENGVSEDVGRLLGVGRQEAQWQTVRNGTLQHEVFEGERATAFVDGDQLKIQVNCRSDAAEFEEPIPYGLAVTLEVAEGIDIPIYSHIRDRIRPAVRVTPHP